MKVRVWGYRDGTLLPAGFEVEVGNRSGRRPKSYSEPFGTRDGEEAAADGLMALLESAGVDGCVGTDQPGEFNADVETWEER